MSDRKNVKDIRAKKIVHGRDSTRIVFIGAGNLGGAVIHSLISRKLCTKKNLYIVTGTESSARRWRAKGFKARAQAYDVVEGADQVWLSVKPYQLKELSSKLSSNLSSKALVISLMAGWAPSKLKKELSHSKVITVMTNTAAQIDKGSFAVFYASQADGLLAKKVAKMISPMGQVCGCFSESLMPQLTALIGSMPAFIMNFMQQYVEFSKKFHISEKQSLKWFSYLSQSAASLIEGGGSVDTLIKNIATPGGCTEVGLSRLNVDRSLLMALEECAHKANEMGK